MFRFLCKKISPFLTTITKKTTAVHSPFQHPFTPRTISTSLTSLYPKKSHGVSTKAALSASEKARNEKADTVRQLLRDYGFDDAHITALSTRFPKVLSLKPEKTLKPKLEFLRSAGFTGHEIADILSMNPFLLRRDLETKIVRSVNFLKAILPSMAAVGDVLKYTNNLLLPEQQPNMEILRKCGVLEPAILELLAFQPRSFHRSADDFAEAIEKVKEMGVDPKSRTFIRAVGVMSYSSVSTSERKLALYRSLGWSDDEIHSMFRKQPDCLNLSDEHIQEKMKFFTNKLGWDPAFISSYPVILKMSLQNRVIPRCSVLNMLMSRGLIKKNTRSGYYFMSADEIFIRRFVNKFKQKVPEVVNAFHGKVAFDGWDVKGDDKLVDARKS